MCACVCVVLTTNGNLCMFISKCGGGRALIPYIISFMSQVGLRMMLFRQKTTYYYVSKFYQLLLPDFSLLGVLVYGV